MFRGIVTFLNAKISVEMEKGVGACCVHLLTRTLGTHIWEFCPFRFRVSLTWLEIYSELF